MSDSFVLVPREPTKSMIAAAALETDDILYSGDWAESAVKLLTKQYKAMLEAAPSPVSNAPPAEEWTENEERVIAELMVKKDLSRHKVLLQALCIYQLFDAELLKRTVKIPKASHE